MTSNQRLRRHSSLDTEVRDLEILIPKFSIPFSFLGGKEHEV